MLQGRDTIQIQVPPLYKEVIELGIDNGAIIHAPLNCRIKETLLAEVLANLTSSFQFNTEPENFLYICRDTNRIRTQFISWLSTIGLSSKPRSKGFMFPSSAIVWILNPKEIVLDDLPFSYVSKTYICDAHTIPEHTFKVLQHISTDIVCAGNMVPRDHWFYRYCKSADNVYRYNANDICEAFPDQWDDAKRLSKDYTKDERRRYLNLEDIEIKSSNFRRFANARLWIKTDRDIRSLHPRQQEYAKDTEGTPVVPYMLTPLNKRYLAMKRLAIKQGRKKRFLLLKYRRGGFTTLEQGLSYHQCVDFSYSQCITLAHTQTSTQRIFKIAKLYQERDPRHPLLASDSKTQLEFADNGSTFFIGTAGGRGVSRGDTIQRVHGSEVSKWCPGPNQNELVEDIIAGLLGAASHGEVILETTPDGFEWFANTYTDAKKELNDWVPLFLPWFVDPVNTVYVIDEEEILDTLTEEEKKFCEKVKRDWNITITLNQIAFRRDKKKEYGRLFRQEYPEDDITCFIISGDPFFNTDLIMDLLDEMPEYKREHVPGGYIERYKEPEAGKKYVAGVDTSEGLPFSDPNGMGILDKETGEQVLSLHGRFPFNQLAELCIKECEKYNRALLGVERNNHGHAVLQRIKELGYKKPNYRGGPLYHFSKDRPGWDTNSQTRPIMLDELSEAIEEKFMTIHDKEFLRECLTFKKQHNGKFEADPNCHDDSVLKWSIAWQMRKQRRPRISYNEV